MSIYSKAQSGSANVSSVTVSNAPQSVLQANDNREGLLIYNDSDRTLLVGFGETVGATDFSIKILPAGYYESGATVYTGEIQLLWVDGDSSGSGQAQVTELEV